MRSSTNRRLLASVMLVAGNTTCAQTAYTVIDLGTLGGPASAAFGVNSAGRAVGVSPLADANLRGFVFGAGTIGQINPLPGDSQCWGFAIAPSGGVVAESFSPGAIVAHGILSVGGSLQSLGGLAPRGINALGTIVGHTFVQDATLGPIATPALWRAGTVTLLPTLGGTFGYAAALNDQEWTVGWTMPAGDPAYRPTLWINQLPVDLGTLGGTSGQAYAISNSRTVAGWGRTGSGAMHAMAVTLSTSGAVASRIDLGSFAQSSSVAYSVNNSSWVVGTSADHAFLWRGSGLIVDLNTLIPGASDWVLQQAWSISDNGYIAGVGTKGGWPRGFVLVPVCYPNCDGSTTPPVLTANDFQCFINKYAAADPYANCDGSTLQPLLTANDFQCFINRHAQGCT